MSGDGYSIVVDAGTARFIKGRHSEWGTEYAATIAEVKRRALAAAINERDEWARCVQSIRAATREDFQ